MAKPITKYFFLSFMGAFASLTLFALVLTYFLNPNTALGAPEDAGQSPGIYLPKEEDTMTVLLIGSKKKEDTPNTYALVRFYPRKGHIPVAVLPGATLVQSGGNKELLSTVYQKNGAKGAVESLSATLQIPIDRYAKVDLDGFVTAWNLLGKVEYTVTQDISYSMDGTQVNIAAGRQLLSGETAARLIVNPSHQGGETARCNAVSDLLTQAINQNLYLLQSQTANALFTQMINLLETDISAADYLSRKDSANFMAALKEKPATSYPVNGSFNAAGNTFTIGSSTYSLLTQVFGNTAVS